SGPPRLSRRRRGCRRDRRCCRSPPAAPARPAFLLRPTPPPSSTFFPYTTLFRSVHKEQPSNRGFSSARSFSSRDERLLPRDRLRSEEHTSELQSRFELVCRILLEQTPFATCSTSTPCFADTPNAAARSALRSAH